MEGFPQFLSLRLSLPNFLLCAPFHLMKGGLPGGPDGQESACNAGGTGSIPGSGRSPGEGNGNLFQYSCLENSMNRRAWLTTVHEVAESHLIEPLTLSLSFFHLMKDNTFPILLVPYTEWYINLHI